MTKKRFSPVLTLFACLLALAIGFTAAFFLYTYIRRPTGGGVYSSGSLQIHFMELGNRNAGDSIYIKAGDQDILIDAGSTAESTNTTAKYIERYCTDGTLEYVIATHADEDHIAGFAGSEESPSIFERFDCEVLIDFPKTNKTTKTYEKYEAHREEAVREGMVHYTALECWEEENGARRVYELASGIEMQVLYNYYYEHETRNENNYSVCLLFSQGDNYFLFTGDLEGEGEELLVQNNELPEVEMLKAGHHGSKTSCNEVLLEAVKPKIVCVSCCAGYNEYHASPENVFPTQAMIDRVAPYTDRVYVTSQVDEASEAGYTPMNGNIVVSSNRGKVEVSCSNDGRPLKDWDWFLQNRTLPQAWR